MPKTDNIPPAYQQMVMNAIELSLAHQASLSKTADQILKEVYASFLEQMKASGVSEEDVNPYLHAYLASAIRRIVRYFMKYADANPPTHRKGYGDAFKTTITGAAPLIFVIGGGQVGGTLPPGGGTGFPDPAEPPPDDYGDDDDVIEWVPDDEVSRAKAKLHEVADRIDFGPGDDPLSFVREVARELGGNWGLNGKRGDPNNPSKDVLAWNIPGYAPQNFDVILDAGGRNGLSWQALPYTLGNAVWIAP